MREISFTEGKELFTRSLSNRDPAILGNILSLFPNMVVEVLLNNETCGDFLSTVEKLINNKSKEVLSLLFQGNTNAKLHLLNAAKKEGNKTIRSLIASGLLKK